MSPRIVAFSDVESAYDHPERVARLAGTVQALDGERTLVVDAGDSTALGALAFATERGRGQARPFRDRVAPAVHVPGNHDFDPGPAWLAGWLTDAEGTPLAANTRDTTDDTRPAPPFEDRVVRHVAGDRVAVIGVAHPKTDRLTTTGDVAFADPVPAVRRLSDASADYTVVVSHGGTHDRRVARETNADLVVGGHSHEPVCTTVAGTRLVRTGAGGHEVAVAALGEDAERRAIADGPVDETILGTYRTRWDDAGLSTQIGHAELSERETVRRVAHAYRREADADCAVVVAASVRRGLSGEITRGDAIGVVPFGSTLQTIAVSGGDLREALAVSADGRLDDTHGDALWAGAEPASGTVGDDPIDPDATYEVAMMSYLAGAGLLPGVTTERVVADHGPQHEAWLADLRAHGGWDTDGCTRTSHYD